MATMPKCPITNSPKGTPFTRHRRRVTLGTLLLNPIESDLKLQLRQSPSRRRRRGISSEGSNTLKDLMATSKNPFDVSGEEQHSHVLGLGDVRERETVGGSGSLSPVFGGSGLRNRRVRQAGWAGFRLQLCKRAWRPMLISIPE